MPFQSEKQRRYLWANEPEIARDWTDTYGSRVKKFDGGEIYKGIEALENPMDYLRLSDPAIPREGYMDYMSAIDPAFGRVKTHTEYDTGYPPQDPQTFNRYGYWDEVPSIERYQDPERFALSEEEIIEKPSGINFNEQYNKGSDWLTDARTADEMAQLPINPLRNKRQKLTDFLSRFIPGASVAKMLRPDANEAYGNVAGLYPEEVWGMQEFGEGDDLRTDPWGKNIVSFAGDYEEGIKDWWDKYGKMAYKTPRMKQKQAWKKRAVEKIRQEEAAREATKRATIQQMSERNRIENTGGWQSGMAADPGFMTGPAEGEQLSDVMGSFNRGGLAALWPR